MFKMFEKFINSLTLKCRDIATIMCLPIYSVLEHIFLACMTRRHNCNSDVLTSFLLQVLFKCQNIWFRWRERCHISTTNLKDLTNARYPRSIDSRTRTINPSRLNKRFGSKIAEGYRVQESPEKGSTMAGI